MWRLRTGQHNLTVDDEERHTIDSKPLCLLVSHLDRIQSFVAVQHALGPLPLQSSFGNHVNERRAIADVPAFHCSHDRGILAAIDLDFDPEVAARLTSRAGADKIA
jgi:hypothetical protein